MKRAVLASFVLFVTALLILASMSSNVKAGNENYKIDWVNHTVELTYNGYVLVNDTIQIRGQASAGVALKNFRIGFPYEYAPYVLRCVAYDSSNVFPVKLNVPLGGRIGFYGVDVDFKQGLNISDGTTHVFTVIFVLSNGLLEEVADGNYTLRFPAYPSLTKPADICNASINLPASAKYISGTVEGLRYSKQGLPAFAYSEALGNLTFSLQDAEQFQLADIENMEREITISGTCEITGSDFYQVWNKATKEMASFRVILPLNASDVQAYDQFGRKMARPTSAGGNWYKITFTLPVKAGEHIKFRVTYKLPKENYIEQKDSKSFNLNFPLFKNLNYYVNRSSVAFILPEGAKIVKLENVSAGESYTVSRDVFQERITINSRDVMSLDGFSVGIAYEYSPLWLSFRPTLWMWALAVVGCVVAVVWKRPKAPVTVSVPTVALRLSSKSIRSFVDAYEEKRKITSEMESLETRVRKGRIPRRRYKVRRKTLETRLNTLSRSISRLKEEMRSAGGKYAGLMRQLEVAETELSEVETAIRSIKARHRRGELSLEAYRRLLADYERRKDKAETTIDGILLRLREEIR